VLWPLSLSEASNNSQFVIYSPEDGLKVVIPRNLDLLAAKHVDAVKGHDGCIRIIGKHRLCFRKIQR
jgi:hypothetical protein